MSYRYVQGIDYGPRDGTLGLSYHMSEGYDGLPEYLARHKGEDLWEWASRVSGVSCHVAILSDGEIVQMLDWRHSSGNLNPDDRSGEYGYYGASHLKAVLGDHWRDPNAWTLSAELAGFRKSGPTDAQVESAIRWGNEMKAMFPSIRGAIGHHDQSPKACPGLTANMKAIFAGLGGHGLWEEKPMRSYTILPNATIGSLVVKGSDHYYMLLEDEKLYGPLDEGWAKPLAFGPVRLTIPIPGGSGDRATGYIVPEKAAFLLATDVTFTPTAVSKAELDAAIASAITADRAKATVVWR